MLNKTIAIASDQGGFNLKKEIIDYLEKEGYECKDYGSHSTASVDYPDFAIRLCKDINNGVYELGILVCGTGQGMAMVANRFDKVRAGVCGDVFSARMIKAHNNANVLCLGGRVVGIGLGLEIVKAWLDTKFDGGRHQPRIDKFPRGIQSNTEEK